MTLWERKVKQHVRLGRLYDLMSKRAIDSRDVVNGSKYAAMAMTQYEKAETMMLEDMAR